MTPQLTHPKAPSEKGSCVAKVAQRSFLIETENENLYRRNRKFIRQIPSKPQHQTQVTQPSAGKVPIQSNSESLSVQFSVPQVPDKDLAN